MLFRSNTGYYAASSVDELTQTVKQQWDESGYRLTGVEYGDGVWFGTFEEDYGANAYSVSTSLTELTEDISEVWSWNQGYDLVDVEYGDGIWFGTVEKESVTLGYSNFYTEMLRLQMEHDMQMDAIQMMSDVIADTKYA